MIRKVASVCLLILLVAGTLGGCAKQNREESGYLLYYMQNVDSGGSSALGSVTWDGAAKVEDMVAALIKGPDREELYSIIPRETTLRTWNLRDGVLQLDLSGEYGTLSGVELTLANACLVMTLCQLDDVNAVAVTAEGETLVEDSQLRTDMFVLEGGGGDQVAMSVTLYFLNEAGSIEGEQRSLLQSENRSRAEEILSALCDGPEQKTLVPILPERPEGISLWIEEGICYINLTEEWKTFLEEEQLSTRLRCVTLSLCQLDDIDAVQFLLEGAAVEDWRGNGADFPLTG